MNRLIIALAILPLLGACDVRVDHTPEVTYLNMPVMDEMNEVYRTYFENPPAQSAPGASGLAMNARVEIECIAVTD